jgi:hypothetical protein
MRDVDRLGRNVVLRTKVGRTFWTQGQVHRDSKTVCFILYLFIETLSLTIFSREAENPSKKRPTQADFVVPRELEGNPNIRKFDGDYLQCNGCGKWIVMDRFEFHTKEKCPRMVRPHVSWTHCRLTGNFRQSLSRRGKLST